MEIDRYDEGEEEGGEDEEEGKDILKLINFFLFLLIWIVVQIPPDKVLVETCTKTCCFQAWRLQCHSRKCSQTSPSLFAGKSLNSFFSCTNALALCCCCCKKNFFFHKFLLSTHTYRTFLRRWSMHSGAGRYWCLQWVSLAHGRCLLAFGGSLRIHMAIWIMRTANW